MKGICEAWLYNMESRERKRGNITKIGAAVVDLQ
jgi:hypothetical protein